MLLLKILGGLAALAFGVWLGRPGRYEQTVTDIDELMDQPVRRPRRVKRQMTPLAWIQRKAPPKHQTQVARFRLSSPDEKD
jgi:hypothetical protein